MADKRISELTNGTPLQSGDYTVIVRNGQNYRADIGNIPFSIIGDTPTTLVGYGITDSYTIAEVDDLISGLTDSYTISSELVGDDAIFTRNDTGTYSLNLSNLITENIISLTYTELLNLYTIQELIVGQKYMISNYCTYHNILDGSSITGEIYNNGSEEPLILTALSSYSFDKQVYSPLFPNDIIYYDITGGDTRDKAFFVDGIPLENLRGIITYRKDTSKNVECGYDFRGVVFRRWLLSGDDWISEHTYTLRTIVLLNNVLYMCIKNHSGSTITPDLDSVNWIYFIDKSRNWSYTSNMSEFYTGNIEIKGLKTQGYLDFNTFGDYPKFVYNASVGEVHLDYANDNWSHSSRLNNNVFYTTEQEESCCNNVLDTNCINNTFDMQCKNNKIDMDFTLNIVQNAFVNNRIKENCNLNCFGYSFTDNEIGHIFYYNVIENSCIHNNFRYNAFSNNIKDGFENNKIDKDFQNNVIYSGFLSNIIGDGFKSNIIGNGSYNNKIGYLSTENTIGDDFFGNIIGGQFQSNTIGLQFNNNIIGDDFMSWNIGDYFSQNVIEYGVDSCVCVDNFQLNHINYGASNTDFTNAFHVYRFYNCDIIKNAANVMRLKFMDDNDNDVIVGITD